ncbi:hypothetical protein [Candidatus Poriferisodalis sp.]|uniref:hypothetical protein n=1 Tax=Candidatus Poriferisodalis sp. TaxID=3101277 RepID=UPI003B02DA87
MSKRRRKQSRTRRIDDTEAQRRQAAEASTAFWHGAAAPATDVSSVEPGAEPSIGPAAPTSHSRWTATRPITVTSDPTSTVRSLGKPPLAGREAAAEHYFEAVYQRAVAMAGALAAAGGLLADDEEDQPGA